MEMKRIILSTQSYYLSTTPGSGSFPLQNSGTVFWGDIAIYLPCSLAAITGEQTRNWVFNLSWSWHSHILIEPYGKPGRCSLFTPALLTATKQWCTDWGQCFGLAPSSAVSPRYCGSSPSSLSSYSIRYPLMVSEAETQETTKLLDVISVTDSEVATTGGRRVVSPETVLPTRERKARLH